MAIRKPLYIDPTYGTATEVSSTDAIQAAQFRAIGTSGAALDANGLVISNVGSPLAAGDVATRGYVDGIAMGISVVMSVKAMSNANVPLTGLQTIDGVQLAAGDRVLLTQQTNPIQNGVWVVSASAWSRPTMSNDYVPGRMFAGLYTYIELGNNFATEQWSAVGGSAGKIDTDPSTWTQLTGAAEITAGPGIAKSAVNGNTLSVALASNSGLQFTANAVDTLLNGAGGLSKDASGLAIKINANNTAAVDGNGLRVLGLPSQFTVAGTAVSNQVSATNLNTLTAGTSSLADSLHQHSNVLQAQSVVGTYGNGTTPIAAGDPVQWSATADQLQRCDAASGATSFCIGVATSAIAANGSGAVVRRGLAAGVLSQATPGSAYYLSAGGALTSTLPTGNGISVVRIGTAKNATDLEVNITTLTQRGPG